MSYSETITKNDLKAILDATLPPTPSEYGKLLWTNPDPTANFSAQTINIDLSDYDVVDVVAVVSRTSGKMGICRIYFSAPVTQSLLFLGDDATKHARDLSINTSGITFQNGYYQYMTSGQSKTTDSGQAIPYKIYGIKYERVNPPQEEIADYVVDQGTSGDWKYRKWNSGIAECWCKITGNWSVNFTSQTSGVYSATGWISNQRSLPSGLFTSVTSASGSVQTSGYTSFQVSSLTTSSITFRAWNSYAVNGMTIYSYTLDVKGTWK